MKDKRITMLYGILICAILALGIGVFSLAMNNDGKDNKEEKPSTQKISTKTRRPTTSRESEITTSEEVTIPPTPASTSITTSSVSSSTVKTTAKTTSKITTKKTTKKTTKSTKKTTKKKTTLPTHTVIPPNAERETTESSTVYPLAQDSIAWDIFDRINRAREKNGLEPVKVAVDLRRLAEEAADYLYDFTDTEVKNYIYGLNNYRRVTNHILTYDQAVLSLYNGTVQNTDIITDKSLRYVGIGVIFRQVGLGDLPTYYYVIIYE